MRFASIVLLGILLSCLSIQAKAGSGCGSNWLGNDAVGYDPDFSVSAHEQGYLVHPSSDLSTPIKTSSSSKPRVAPDERGRSIPQSSANMSMPDPSPKPLIKPNDTASNQTSNSSSTLAQTQDVLKLIDVNGKWLVEFNESMNRSLNLNLFTNQDRVMGSGTLEEDGTEIPLTASGSVSANELILTAKTVIGPYVNQIDRQFDLEMHVLNDTLSGRYIMKSAGKFLSQGNASMTK